MPYVDQHKKLTDGQLLVRVNPVMSLVYAQHASHNMPPAVRDYLAHAAFCLPRFTLDMVVGHEIIDRRLVPNPRPFDHTFGGPNPEHYNVLLFRSGSKEPVFLLTDEWGGGGSAYQDHYFYDGDHQVFYSNKIFGKQLDIVPGTTVRPAKDP